MQTINITSYEIPFCAYCSLPITEENDSGWEVFPDRSAKTQPICTKCEVENNKEIEKQNNS